LWGNDIYFIFGSETDHHDLQLDSRISDQDKPLRAVLALFPQPARALPAMSLPRIFYCFFKLNFTSLSIIYLIPEI